MSTNEQYPVNDGGNSTSEQIPHSGVRGYESPVTEFDNTSLQDAHDQGLLEIPENPSSLTKESKKGMSWKTKLGLALAGLGIAGTGGMVAKSVAGGEPAPAPERNPAASATPNAGETPAESSSPEAPETNTAGATELTVDRYKDGESLTNAWIAEKNDYMMGGADSELMANEDPVVTRQEYIAQAVAPIDEAHISTHYVSDWEQRPELAVQVNEAIDIHHALLYAYMGTTNTGEPADVEPYNHTWTVTSVEEISNTGNEIVVEYHYVRQDNSDKNRASEFLDQTYSTPVTGAARITWVAEDGVWKIAKDVPVQ